LTPTIVPTSTLEPPVTGNNESPFNIPEGKALFVFHNNSDRDWKIDVGPYFFQVPAGQTHQIVIAPGTYKWKALSADGRWNIRNPESGGIDFEFTVAAGEVYEFGQ
jgi:hypothetical protein